MGYIMESEELLSMFDMGNIRICDCRFKLGAPDVGRNEYEKEHISGAVYFDLEKDLSGQVEEHGVDIRFQTWICLKISSNHME